jgi:hypothetical protein
VRIGRAVRVEENIGARVARCRLAKIDCDVGRGLSVMGREMHHHEAAAAEVARPRQGHRNRESDGDGCIDRIAAAPQDVDADAGRALLLRHHHAVRRRHGHGMRRRRRGAGRGRLGEADRRHDDGRDYKCSAERRNHAAAGEVKINRRHDRLAHSFLGIIAPHLLCVIARFKRAIQYSR